MDAGSIGQKANLRQNGMPRPLSDTTSPGELGYEYTIRGQLHWLSVMADWRWEGAFSLTFFVTRLLLPLILGLHFTRWVVLIWGLCIYQVDGFGSF